ncbi:MAG: hypothetical protein MR713_10335, partial [Firmicutes bacterium]|nr:hypothetical protein [Bacillota bacterium]
HKCLPRTKLKDIEPYGRCSEEDNRNNVTGAKGVPNFGGESGAQLLAITVADGEIINIRWTGSNRLSLFVRRTYVISGIV